MFGSGKYSIRREFVAVDALIDGCCQASVRPPHQGREREEEITGPRYATTCAVHGHSLYMPQLEKYQEDTFSRRHLRLLRSLRCSLDKRSSGRYHNKRFSLALTSQTATMAHVAPSFTTADYLVFTASLVISLGIGFYHWFRSRGRGTKDFLMGGGHMSPIPVSLSFAAGVISAVSILGNSAEMYYYGSQLWMNVIGVTIGTVFIMGIVMPVIFPLKLITIYEPGAQDGLGSATLNLSIYMGIALYAPSLAISSVTPISANTSVLVLGIVCTVYASMGGAKAVVYTDNFQSR
ncbi:Sodium-dependent multivitamin transporter [Chionoecetes opilio]|uniref:Sodium-dependent multivitamin transporter n=1 Tax=Chionoecetes opilio TaxID=41210 RepID=A0A8J4XU68_CHIOP|nr:Sodium-dependent multivitamin transporter [Chionoecetes opilio]